MQLCIDTRAKKNPIYTTTTIEKFSKLIITTCKEEAKIVLKGILDLFRILILFIVIYSIQNRFFLKSTLLQVILLQFITCKLYYLDEKHKP